jgi:hypothetical protein
MWSFAQYSDAGFFDLAVLGTASLRIAREASQKILKIFRKKVDGESIR